MYLLIIYPKLRITTTYILYQKHLSKYTSLIIHIGFDRTITYYSIVEISFQKWLQKFKLKWTQVFFTINFNPFEGFRINLLWLGRYERFCSYPLYMSNEYSFSIRISLISHRFANDLICKTARKVVTLI